jgi:hypothetical protein
MIPSLALVSAVMLTGCVRGDVRSPDGEMSMAPPSVGLPGPNPVPVVPTPPPSPGTVPQPTPAPSPTPSPAPTPAPTPTPTPTPAPTPGPTLPPLGPLVDLDDNHAVGISYWMDRDPTIGARGELMDGRRCWPGTEPPDTYHVHTHLSILLDDVALRIPEDIGIVTSPKKCAYSLHTHNHSGKLHVEGPAPEVFTLGEFFRIWGQPLGPDNVAGLTGKPIVVYITDHNGVVTLATGDWNDIELLSHREITIQVGTTVSYIPNFTWSAH